MCGIWCRIGSKKIPEDPSVAVKKLEARGPEGTRIIDVDERVTMGFTRLAINGLTDAGMQPYSLAHISWMCNGEIYNSASLEKKLHLSNTGSDCQCIGELYLRHSDNLVAFARALDGVFAITLYDSKLNRLIVTRDPFGIRPLFIGKNKDLNAIVFSSEMKSLSDFEIINVFAPGTIQCYDTLTLELIQNIKYHTINSITHHRYLSRNCAINDLRYALEQSIIKRLLTDRPIACLLSGGLDSSLIASLLQKNIKKLNGTPLKTFSIGFEGSSDLAHAQIVSKYIESDHTEIKMTPDDFFNAIPEVIRAIESYDTTTVRASVGNYLIGKKIKELSDCKVVFNGDGSDELFGGYLYFYNAPNSDEFHSETERLLTDIHTFDVLRSDRCMSANGLEARTPFLDKQFVSIIRSVDPYFLLPIHGKEIEKKLLRDAFNDRATLPDAILWRRKEAFSDGVSTPEKAWFQEIQDRVSKIVPEDWKERLNIDLCNDNLPRTAEEYYYRSLFIEYFGTKNLKTTVPYRWMPRWCPETNDPSAKTLNIYNGST
jgi:asparagine synthase (glutamine-hydrolysing)